MGVWVKIAVENDPKPRCCDGLAIISAKPGHPDKQPRIQRLVEGRAVYRYFKKVNWDTFIKKWQVGTNEKGEPEYRPWPDLKVPALKDEYTLADLDTLVECVKRKKDTLKPTTMDDMTPKTEKVKAPSVGEVEIVDNTEG